VSQADTNARVLAREEVPAPTVRTEAVPVPSLGGSVLVRAGMYSERQQVDARARAATAHLQTGTTDQAINEQIGFVHVLHALAAYVVLADGEPMWTLDQWNVHAAQHIDEVLALYEVTKRLNGRDVEGAAKN
jgi:hypothetical protein